MAGRGGDITNVCVDCTAPAFLLSPPAPTHGAGGVLFLWMRACALCNTLTVIHTLTPDGPSRGLSSGAIGRLLKRS